MSILSNFARVQEAWQQEWIKNKRQQDTFDSRACGMRVFPNRDSNEVVTISFLVKLVWLEMDGTG